MAATVLIQADTPRSWSDLPVDLAAVVLLRLPSRHLDRVRFGAVCRQWRAAAVENPALPPYFPWLALPDGSTYSLPASAVRPLLLHLDGHRQLPGVQSSCGEWLVFERQDGALALRSPFSAAAATLVLPGLHTLYDPQEPCMRRPTIRKLVVCSDDLIAAAVAEETETETWENVAVIVKLALCRPGASSWSWAALESGPNRPYGDLKDLQDIILYKGQLHALKITRALFSVSVSKNGVTGEPVVSKVRRVISVDRPTWTPFNAAPPFYLLESQGRLLLIYRRGKLDGKKRKKKRSQGEDGPEMVTKFVVFVADFERSKWKRAVCNTELREAVSDDRVLFLGPWYSRSIAIPRDQHNKGYIDMGGNSIIFFSDVFFFFDDDRSARDYHQKRVPFYCNVYDIKTRQSQLLLQASLWPLKGFQAMWLFPPIEA